MEDKKKIILYFIGCIYLIYLSISMVKSAMKGTGSNSIVIYLFSGLFLILGILGVVFVVRHYSLYIKEQKNNEEDTEIEEEKEEK